MKTIAAVISQEKLQHMAHLVCRMRFSLHSLIANVFIYHAYLLAHLFVLRRFWQKRGQQKVETERERIRAVWKEIVANDLTSMTMSDFKQKDKCNGCEQSQSPEAQKAQQQ